MANYPQNSNSSDLGSWILVLIMLAVFWPVGLVLLFRKLMRSAPRQRHPYDIQRQRAQSAGAAAPARGESRRKMAPAAAIPDRGKKLTIAGAIMAAVFGFGALDEFLSAVSGGWLLYALSDIFIPLGLCGVGLVLLYCGVARTKQAKRFRKYLALIGKRKSISLSNLAQAMPVSLHRACDDLQEMLDLGYIPQGFLDLANHKLVLSDEGLPEEEPAPQPKKEKPPQGMEAEDAVLSEIQAVNDAIENPELSLKIDRIGEITGNIFAYLRENPGKEGQLRSFLSYYLPTTLKILRAYAQMESQGVEGENISAAKDRIEGMMDKVVEGFEKQLDKLFQDSAMDITSDVEVLERMLAKDGLSHGDGLQIGG